MLLPTLYTGLHAKGTLEPEVLTLAGLLLVGCRSGLQKAEEALKFRCLHCRSASEQVAVGLSIA